MRLGTAQRRRSWVWWGVIVSALLIFGAYLIFDILDVDGSQMISRPADGILMAEALQVEADRFFRADPFTPDSIGFLSLSLSRSSTTERHGLSLGTIPIGVRQRRMLPRVNLQRALAKTGPLSADPA
ncbi:MAG: hypothetical protein NTW68_09150 [candidate division NC10 bacterium]|nr:hypothetical protein [candidate division NC10 bacterium]